MLCGLYLAFSCFSALVQGGGDNGIYLDNYTTWNLGLSGDIYSHTGYPNETSYPERLYAWLSLTGLLYSGVTSVLVVRFTAPFNIPSQTNTCSGGHLYLAGLILCDAVAPARDHYISRLLLPQIAAVNYIADPGDRGDGFHFEYAVAAPIRNRTSHDSVQELWDREGYITSHSTFPEIYTPGINSSLTLRGLQHNRTVSITFLSFNIYYHRLNLDCNKDYLQIEGVTGIDSVRFCGNPNHKPQLNIPYKLVSDGYSITFRFVTDIGNSLGSGFFFRYTAETSVVTTGLPQSPQTTINSISSSQTTTTSLATNITLNRTGGASTSTQSSSRKEKTVYIGVGVGVSCLSIIVCLPVVAAVCAVRRRRNEKNHNIRTGASEGQQRTRNSEPEIAKCHIYENMSDTPQSAEYVSLEVTTREDNHIYSDLHN